MKIKKHFLIILCLIPSVAFASVGSDLNDMLKRFFGGEIETNGEVALPIESEFEIPETPTEEDFLNIQKKIREEEQKLEQLSTATFQSQQNLWKAQSEKYTLQGQLLLLDQELSLLKSKIEKFIEQQNQWQGELSKITKEKEVLAALVRVKKEEFDRFLKKNYIRNENFGKGESVSVFKWLFSKKSVGAILQEQRQVQQFQQQKKAGLIELEYLKKELQNKERHAALLFQQAKTLKDQIAAEKRGLVDFAETKAHLIARSEFTEGKTAKEIENYERQTIEKETFLQKLQSVMEEMQGKLGYLPEDEGFKFPLPIEMEVSASFHDPAYEKALGKVHKGVDFVAPHSTDIFAPRSGIVSKVSFDTNEYGYAYLILDHGEELFTVYGHVSDILVNEGQEVVQGDLIAKTGGTQGAKGSGYFTAGPHLHFEVYEKGEHRDPMELLEK
jgi:murein DD-endopeptidase MepM/ murein hydrolase activator NlpD